ncbi:MAG: hypothetical protein JWN17_693, partial [Frankiales bacterium]|nr:hypothetical protein [Frankiales bacterium]
RADLTPAQVEQAGAAVDAALPRR